MKAFRVTTRIDGRLQCGLYVVAESIAHALRVAPGDVDSVSEEGEVVAIQCERDVTPIGVTCALRAN